MKQFEDVFMEIQIGLVSLANEFVDGHADKIYVYCMNEKSSISYNAFYKIGSYYSHLSAVNRYLESDKQVDTSHERLKLLTGLGISDLEKLREVANEFNREIPSEMWLIYDVNKGSLDTRYSYEERYSKDENLLFSKVFGAWFEEVKTKNL